MRRFHPMPFGAECLTGALVHFRLWARKANRVSVCLGEGDAKSVVSMRRLEHGWFELQSQDARPGTRYRFKIDDRLEVPDPASRFQPDDVHGPSEVINPSEFSWTDDAWRGRPWEEAVIYELHVGTFTSEGTFHAVEEQLDYLTSLGVTAVELMPLSDFPGKRNWGYDGVLPFAPDSAYGRPEDLKRLVQSAHHKNLMVLLDVVDNHFGAEGNYLGAYAPEFFTARHATPWGEAINFDGDNSRVVRDFFIHNALYWLTEYHFDGLRFDAVHAIRDDSSPDILTELAHSVRNTIGSSRHVHLVLENDNNAAHYLARASDRRPKLFDAQWNDDLHHALHVAISGENDGYYSDYADCPIQHLGRALAEGFAYQGQPSSFRGGRPRGEPSRSLPPTAFVSFLQNHDQIGNRAFGERILQLVDLRALKAAMTILLLAPSPPLLFMGEEFGAETPFLFFCDFRPDLAQAVREGRRREFSKFAPFADPNVLASIPDPSAESTFLNSKLDWSSLSEAKHQGWLSFYRDLLQIRAQKIVPLLPSIRAGEARWESFQSRGLHVWWPLSDRGTLTLVANLGLEAIPRNGLPWGRRLYATESTGSPSAQLILPSWSAEWFLNE